MSLIDEVLAREELRARPPVLVDIGASGELPRRWRRLAPLAICLAFDADDREFGAREMAAHPYRALHLHHHIVSDRPGSAMDFYLTRSPYCSSTLPPATESLAPWIFADLFEVVERVKLPARTLPEVLAGHGLSYVDWFKTDSQGSDLRLFLSLGVAIVERVLIASFEPGIIDAYLGEDKLHALLARMDTLPFWMHEMEIRGTQRLARALWEERVRPRSNGFQPLGLRTSPGWAEVSYLNTLVPTERFDRRDLLLAWAIASLHGQHGFALEIATRGHERFGDALFGRMGEASLGRTLGLAGRVPGPALKALRFVRRAATRLRAGAAP
jgi:hypothetical protein